MGIDCLDFLYGSRRDAFSARTNDRTERSRLLFVLFLYVQEKNIFLLSKGKRYVLFSVRRKAPKDSPRLPSRTPIVLLGSIYTRAPNRRNRALACTLRHSPCGKFVRLGSPRPQAQTAGLHSPPVRRVPPWIARVYRVQTRAGSRRDAFSARTNGQAVRLRFLFVLFLCVQEKNTFLLCKGENMCFSH